MHFHSPDCDPRHCGAQEAYFRLGAWTADDSVYTLESGAFSPEARRHYRQYVTAWLNWCDLESLDPYTCDRTYIATWLADAHADTPVSTRAVMASAVTSFYQHLLHLGIADGIEPHLTRKALTGAVVPTDPQRTGLKGDGPRWFMQAADRLRGRDAARDRAICYLLLNQHFGKEKLRPGALLTMSLEGRTNEGFRHTWKIKPKNAAPTATITIEISRDAARAIDDYLPDRAHHRTHGTTQETGPLFTSTSNRSHGSGLARSDMINRIIRRVIQTHHELAPYTNTLTADFIANTPPPPKPTP